MTEFEKQDILKKLVEGSLDLACEKCGYNLRGLAGRVKICPECASPNSVVLDDVSETELFKQLSRIRSRVGKIAILIFCSFFVLIVFAMSIVVIGEDSLCCCGVLVVLLMLFCLTVEPLHHVFPEDRFYTVLRSFGEIAISIAVFQLGVIAGVFFICSSISYEYRLASIVQLEVAGLVVGVLSLFVVIQLAIRSVRKITPEERQQIMREGAVRLANEARWEHIYKRVGATSARWWKEMD